MKKSLTLISILFFITFSIEIAEANSTLRFNFRYKDSNGVEKALPYAFVYLQDGTKDPPMEKYFSKALYRLWGSYGTGLYIVSVPPGTYYMRITQRNPLPNGRMQEEGPPRPGDYTWRQVVPITIDDNTTYNLGTLYAELFGGSGITITGTVRNTSGAPLSGRYVRAQTVPCYTDGYNYNINQCGPDKYLALQQTDTDGNYTMVLRTPGTYYMYISSCLGDEHQEYTGNPCMGTQGGTITVQAGETKNLNMTAY